VFSLGELLTFAATGHGPFGTALSATLLYRVVFASPDTTSLPAELRPLVERCLAKDPHQRPSAEQLLTELNTDPPAPGWLPEPITQAFPSHAPTESGPVVPTAADGLSTTPRRRAEGRPGHPRPELVSAAAVTVALVVAYLVVAMTAHLPPFSKTSAVPSPPATTTTAPPSPGPRPSPAVSSLATSPFTSPASSPASSPATGSASSPATSPASSAATSPATSSASSPAASASSSAPSSDTTSSASSPAASASGSPEPSAGTSRAAS
jgi:eukaryotic-like serine/threonine-protein kinase